MKTSVNTNCTFINKYNEYKFAILYFIIELKYILKKIYIFKKQNVKNFLTVNCLNNLNIYCIENNTICLLT